MSLNVVKMLGNTQMHAIRISFLCNSLFVWLNYFSDHLYAASEKDGKKNDSLVVLIYLSEHHPINQFKGMLYFDKHFICCNVKQ